MVDAGLEPIGDPDSTTGTTLQMARERPCATWNVEGGPACTPSARTVGEGETIVIGSSKNADMRVFDSAVSGRHCALTVHHGELTISDPAGEVVSRVPLVPGKAVPEAGLWTRATDSVRLWFN